MKKVLAAFAAVAIAVPALAGITVTYNGEKVLPSFGSVAGFWFYESADGEQCMIFGLPGDSDWTEAKTSDGWRMHVEGDDYKVERRPYDPKPIECSSPIADVIAEAQIIWDWKLADGIVAPVEKRTYAEACQVLRERFAACGLANPPPETGDEAEWLALHKAIRERALADLGDTPLLFAKFVPGAMSHQLTQALGYCSRPGGGLFVLDRPGRDMKARDVTPSNLVPGSFMNPELSPDATKILFSYAGVEQEPSGTYTGDPDDGWRRFCSDERMDIHYNIYESPVGGGEARRLTDDGFDDMFPIYLPDGDILFSSTRRGGYHRCGMGPCPVFTMSRMGPDGENPHSISYHETHEWTPQLMADGRLLYSRWDYVDRNGVLYQQLWTARPDGGGVRMFYGNNTWNPCGTWEARPIPGSTKVMAIAGPHHGMAAGSVIRIDTNDGIDFLGPITRLTPDTRFPESEEPIACGALRCREVAFDFVPQGYWYAGLLDDNRNQVPTTDELRWPGHCYKAPWPIDENRFLVSFSYDRLLGEPGGNTPNQFGIYYCDAETGVRELIYRDPRLSSVWVRQIAKRELPAAAATSIDATLAAEGKGTYFLADVTEAWPERLPADRPVKALRIFHVINKTTPNIDSPKVAIGLGALGREILGTVPVEEDGSAYFEAPSGMPLYFQALDENMRAIQTMRSIVYLQPGERESCVGCHEDRRGAMPPVVKTLKAQLREPSKIEPCPFPGARPYNYLKLVQPIIDAKCLKCHDGSKENLPVLTGEQEGWAVKSFNALINLVRFSSWNQEPRHNDEPLTKPLTFGALASPLSQLLDDHHGVELTKEERLRFDTWMDANGACWGTFDAENQRDL